MAATSHGRGSSWRCLLRWDVCVVSWYWCGVDDVVTMATEHVVGVTQSTFHWWRDKSDSTTEHDEAGLDSVHL